MEAAQHLGTTRQCAVCNEGFPDADFPSLEDCEHLPQICQDCYTRWIASSLETSTYVNCPHTDCVVLLAFHQMRQYASPTDFEKYDDFQTYNILNKDPDFRWCGTCKSGQIQPSGDAGNIFTCVSCGHKTCTAHKRSIAWHEGLTCRQYEDRISGSQKRIWEEQEAASGVAISKLAKKCPGPNCGYNIEKNNGRDHMTCSQCQHDDM